MLDFYLHHPSVSQPVEFFHTSLLSFYHQAPVPLWDVQEDDPAYVRYVTDDGWGDHSAAPGRHTGSWRPRVLSLLSNRSCWQSAVSAAREFFAHCGGYFKWPRKDYGCTGVKALFRTLRDAGAALP